MVVDPVHKVGDLRVHAGVGGARTAVAPGDDAILGAVSKERTTRVSLASVLSALRQARADHMVGDVGNTVGDPAVGVTHDGDLHLQKLAISDVWWVGVVEASLRSDVVVMRW